MYGSSAAIDARIAALAGRLVGRDADVVLFPPVPYLSLVVAHARRIGASVGAQNIHPEREGAFTGEVAAEMIRDLGGDYALVGHSERRRWFAEDDGCVAAKFGAARRAGLTPVLCVGETLAEREAGEAVAVVQRQIGAVIDQHGIRALGAGVIAYEPVWAIGTGLTAKPEDAQAMHAGIRAWIAGQDGSVAAALRILYGGSVDERNAGELMAQTDVDGLLVGGASLDARRLVAIYDAV